MKPALHITKVDAPMLVFALRGFRIADWVTGFRLFLSSRVAKGSGFMFISCLENSGCKLADGYFYAYSANLVKT